jgi:hypothetical protein
MAHILKMTFGRPLWLHKKQAALSGRLLYG